MERTQRLELCPAGYEPTAPKRPDAHRLGIVHTHRRQRGRHGYTHRNAPKRLEADERLALVLCDHLLPGESGVSFLVTHNADARTRHARKVLVTGQAGLEDTTKAVNQAGLDHYIAKPWSREELQAIVREQLTSFVVEHVDDLLPFVSVLDGPRLLEAMKSRNRHE